MPPDLNPAQRQAVQTLSGPLLVLAGAGTGKTRVVTYRIAELIRRGTHPQRILAVTFTNKAAAEMKQRVGLLLAKRFAAHLQISTFHSLCVRILRRHIRKLGYPQSFAIYDRGDQESIARTVLREIKVPGETLRPGDLLGLISRWKSSSVRPPQAASNAATDREHLAAVAYRKYQHALKNAGAVDFDDLLLCTEQLFERFAESRKHEAERFDHLLIDEYQDTNVSQYRIAKALAERHTNICVVGDDDQSIYGWRGAEVEHILGFTRDWPTATVVRLEKNYRSTSEILKMANRLIAFNKRRHGKRLHAARAGGSKPRVEQYRDETQEAKSVVRYIQRQLEKANHEPQDFAIFFRTNEQPRAFETELRKVMLPYVLIGGMSFFDRKEVRDILAYLKLLASPQDEVSLLRIINTPPRGIGTRTVESVVDLAVKKGLTAWEILSRHEAMLELPPAAAAAARTFVKLMDDHRQMLCKTTLVETSKSLISRIEYEGELRRLYHEANERQARWDAVQEIVNALAAHEKSSKKPTMQGFLDEMSLDSRDFGQEKNDQLNRNAIALMTLHSAKGLEFPCVFMVGLEEGLLPHHRSVALNDEAVEEERRLCYVGVTRAQEQLTLSLARTRMKWGKPRETVPSRFLYELTEMVNQPQNSGVKFRLKQASHVDARRGTTPRKQSKEKARRIKQPPR